MGEGVVVVWREGWCWGRGVLREEEVGEVEEKMMTLLWKNFSRLCPRMSVRTLA